MTIETELLIINKYKLTTNELFLLKLLILALEEEKLKYLYNYLQENEFARKNLRETLISLQNNNIINNSYKIPEKGEKFKVEDIILNKNFLKEFYKNSGILGQDLFDNFPPFLETNTVLYPLRNIAKKYNSLEEFFFVYGKIIKFDYETHKKILDILFWAKENNLVTWTITEFVISNKWLELELLKNSDYGELKTIENI